MARTNELTKNKEKRPKIQGVNHYIEFIIVVCVCYANQWNLFMVNVKTFYLTPKRIVTFTLLTHFGLVTPYNDIDLGQNWLR